MVIDCGDGFNRGHSLAEALHPCVRYKQVSAGYKFCVLLTNGGSVVIVNTIHLRISCSISDPKDGVIFLQVSAGYDHSLLLRSDGLVDTYGGNCHAQCDIPELETGLFYTQVSAGGEYSLLLRSVFIIPE